MLVNGVPCVLHLAMDLGQRYIDHAKRGQRLSNYVMAANKQGCLE